MRRLKMLQKIYQHIHARPDHLRDALNRGDMLGPEMVATGAILDGNPPLIPLISIGV